MEENYQNHPRWLWVEPILSLGQLKNRYPFMTKPRSLVLAAAALAAIVPLAACASNSPAVDTNCYTLFNPAPDVQLRPLSSEAYDGLTDARTLDAGHVQVEGALLNYYFSGSTPQFYEKSTSIWEPRITLGLLNNLDLFVRPSYVETTDYFNHSHSHFSTLTTGLKLNLWGNDEGTTALAIRPYAGIPTSNSGVVGGGVDLALLVRLPQGFWVKVDSEFYTTGNDNDQAGFDNSLSLNKSLCSKVDAYCYVNTVVTTIDRDPWYGYTGLGLDYNFTPNLQLFAGFGFGFTSPNWVQGQVRAYDYNPRLGVVWRF